ncbi:MAG: hypothetical protein ACI4KB_09105 [Oscillospiraceae bacterium]|nr:hypothetical protein [Oscillospiraceae bacterium]
MQQNTGLISRFPAILAAALMLLTFFCSNSNDKTDIFFSRSCDVSYSINHSPDIALPAVIRTEEVISSDNARITGSNSVKKSLRPSHFYYILKGTGTLSAALITAFITSLYIGTDTVFSRRYILKYIHDQDGHKG